MLLPLNLQEPWLLPLDIDVPFRFFPETIPLIISFDNPMGIQEATK